MLDLLQMVKIIQSSL